MGYGHPQSEETRAKISAAKKGIPMTDEQRLARMGHYVSPEACAKMSAAQMGHVETVETRMKISQALKGPSGPMWKGGTQIWVHKASAKRRLLGFVPLNEWFLDCEAHHIDAQQVIYMPRALHRSIYHRQSDGRGMDAINALAYEWLEHRARWESCIADST